MRVFQKKCHPAQQLLRYLSTEKEDLIRQQEIALFYFLSALVSLLSRLELDLLYIKVKELSSGA